MEETSPVPEEVKENIRAVLLSKTDGSGILVTNFLSDYRSCMQKQLRYKDMGFNTLEALIKNIPDVCRLEYSEAQMAYKLYGVTKPNTFVSSFVKRAATGKKGQPDSDGSKQRSQTVRMTSDLNEKWEPNKKGLYTLCLQYKKYGLTRETIAMQFSQAGEVVEINITERYAFIRYRHEMDAKRAVELWGENMGVKRADEKKNNFSNNSQENSSGGGGNGGCQNNDRNSYKRDSDRRTNGGNFRNNRSNNQRNDQGMSEARQFDGNNNNFDDDEWEDELDGDSGIGCKNVARPPGQVADCGVIKRDEINPNGLKSSPTSGTRPDRGGTRGPRNEQRAAVKSQEHNTVNDPDRTEKNRQGGQQEFGGDRPSNGDRGEPKPFQVYVGNWPQEAQKKELLTLIRDYNHCGCRVMHSKKEGSKKSFAFVDFMTMEDSVEMVRELHGTVYMGRDLQVRMGRNSQVSEDVFERKMQSLSMSNATSQNSLSNVASQNRNGPLSPAVSKGPGSSRGQMHSPSVQPIAASPARSDRSSVRNAPVPHRTAQDENDFNDMPSLEPVHSPLIEQHITTSQHASPNLANGGLLGEYEHRNKPYSQPLSPVQVTVNRSLPMSPNMPPLERNVPAQEFVRTIKNTPNMPALERNVPAQEYSRRANNTATMPELERNLAEYEYSNGYKTSSQNMPPLEWMDGRSGDSMLPARGAMGQSTGPVVLNVTNFPYGTTEEMLYELFQVYGVEDIKMINSKQMGRSSCAMVTLCDARHAAAAVADLDQMSFRSRPLTVLSMNPEVDAIIDQESDQPQHPRPPAHHRSRGVLANIKCTVSGSNKHVTLGNTSSSDSLGDTTVLHQYGDRRPKRNFLTKNDFNFSMLTAKLKDFLRVNLKLRDEDYKEHVVGMQMKLMITHVENEKFFWAQILEDTVVGGNMNLGPLRDLSMKVQSEDVKQGLLQGLGRCCAKYEGDWYRGWCVCDTVRKGVEMGEILFIDYGNTSVIPKDQVFYAKAFLWSLPPMARPFKLTEPNMDLESLVNQIVVVEVLEVGVPKLNFVTKVAFCDDSE